MVALSRNTASVAQDFHNAGGEKMNETQMQNVDIKFLALVQWEIDECNQIEANNSQENGKSHDGATVRMSISPPAIQINNIRLKLNAYCKDDSNENNIRIHPNDLASPNNHFTYYLCLVKSVNSVKIYFKSPKIC